jgi:RNA polymerase sigma-70 factor (sigma-E family)
MMASVAPVDPIPSVPPLDELYRAHYRDLVRLAALLLDDVGECEEVVQDAFVKFALRRDQVDDAERTPAYLRSAVLNGARDRLRRRRTRLRHLASVRAPAPDRSPEARVVEADEQRRVLAALRGLPDRQREVLVLRYHLDLSEAEIADTLGIARGSVKTHAHRGLRHLAELLEDQS